MKFSQLLEYNLRNIFLENHTKNVVEKLFPDPFLKKSKLSISLDLCSNILYILFLLFVKLRAIEIDWNQAVDHLHLPHIKLF